MHSLRERSPAKSFGRFYTPSATAKFVTELIASSTFRTVLDPACGNGIFLAEAAKRLGSVQRDEDTALTGVDLDGAACAKALSTVEEAAPSARTRIINRDFFAVTPEDTGEVEVVLGNPPFIRYQAFSKRIKERALKRAAEAGVVLSRLSNAWAPFVVYAISFLKTGGRMGLILPAELLHARYARPVLRMILEYFRRVRILTFDIPLFPLVDVLAVVLVAEDAGSRCEDFQVRRVRDSRADGQWITTAQWTGADLFTNDRANTAPRVSEYYLPPDLRSIYRRVSNSESARPVGEILSIDIGYVTGDHDYFHLTKDGVRNWRIPRKFCLRSLRNLRGIKGNIFTARDWERMRDAGTPSYLFHVPGQLRGADLKRIQPYLNEGIRRGASRRYQCRARDPWFSVRNVRFPDGFVTSMSSGFARLVVNEAGVAASNSLHIVSRQPGIDRPFFNAVAASWYSSYTMISTYLESHVLGGGLRKLEPSEAERVSVIVPPDSRTASALAALLPEVDNSLRGSNLNEASALLDELLLIDLAGLTSKEANELAAFARAHSWPRKSSESPRPSHGGS